MLQRCRQHSDHVFHVLIVLVVIARADNLKPSGFKFGETMGFGLPPWLVWILSIAAFAFIGYLLKMLFDMQNVPATGRGKPKQKK